MGTTTSYGSWFNVMQQLTSPTPDDDVLNFLGDFSADYDVDALITAYRQAIAERLDAHPELSGVTLAGDEFYGPYPRPEGATAEMIREAIEEIDLDALAHRFEWAD